jgi:hypothetical protein
MTKEERERRNRAIENSNLDGEYRKYVVFMCKKGCKFYINNRCTKKRPIMKCVKENLKNKD